MLNKMFFYLALFFLLILKFSNCFIALPFNTIYIKNESITPRNDYRAELLQNEIYVNLSLGTPMQNITSILRMDFYGFSVLYDSFNYNLSTSNEFIDDKVRLTCYLQLKSTTYKDYCYVPSFNSFNELNECISNPQKLSNYLKSEKVLFLWLSKHPGSITKFNDVYKNFGIIGLKLNFNKAYTAPEFVTTFTELKGIKTHTFYLKYDNSKTNGFFNSNNTGYFIVGEELTEDENEKSKIKYTRARERIDQINWDLAFDDILSRSINDETIEYRPEYKHAELYVNFPYILGDRGYETFIRKAFFQYLLKERVCDYTYTINFEEYAGYKCDSKSELFMEYLNKKFPDLIFEHKELEEKFIFTKNDLFTYNIYNTSDTYLYFLVLFPMIKDKYHPMSWILGAPFFKKYTLSFNYDSLMIGYYKKQENNLIQSSNFNYKQLLIIIVFIATVILAFILGMYTHKKIIKSPRKSRANELVDTHEYNENNLKDDIINN
jgi:hypothetical protein